MKKAELIVNGVAYPCGTLTMGALLRFERETGKNAMVMLSPEELKKGISFSDLGTLMWACAASATRAEGREFKIACIDFLDACPPEMAEAWLTGAIMDQASGKEDADNGSEADSEKKSPTA